MNFARILLCTNKCVMPHHLLQSLQAVREFYYNGILTVMPLVQSSSLGAFPFFRDLMAARISCFSGGAVLMSRSTSASCISVSSTGGGVFRISLKYSAQCAFCSLSIIRSFPSLSLIGTSLVPQNLQQIILVIL